jgi:hypothetical protein
MREKKRGKGGGDQQKRPREIEKEKREKKREGTERGEERTSQREK